jgi:hypothetical protein
MMPVMGNLTIVVAALSYAGQLNLTAVADHDHCPDLEIFTHGVHTTLDDLARSALVPARLGMGVPTPAGVCRPPPLRREGIDAPVE